MTFRIIYRIIIIMINYPHHNYHCSIPIPIIRSYPARRCFLLLNIHDSLPPLKCNGYHPLIIKRGWKIHPFHGGFTWKIPQIPMIYRPSSEQWKQNPSLISWNTCWFSRDSKSTNIWTKLGTIFHYNSSGIINMIVCWFMK